LNRPTLENFFACFRATNTWAQKNGYIGGFPTFFHWESLYQPLWEAMATGDITRLIQAANHSLSGTATISTGGAADFLSELRPNDLYIATQHRPDKYSPALRDTAFHGKALVSNTVCGMVMIKPEFAEFRSVRVGDLGNPLHSDIAARFMATHDYAVGQGFVSGFPTFFDQDFSLKIFEPDIRCGRSYSNPRVRTSKTSLSGRRLLEVGFFFIYAGEISLARLFFGMVTPTLRRYHEYFDNRSE
jgi:hypothetical protein